MEKKSNRQTGALGEGDGGDEGHEVAAAKEAGDEESDVGLSVWRRDPIQACPQNAGVATSLSKRSTPIAAAHPLQSLPLPPSLSVALSSFFEIVLGE